MDGKKITAAKPGWKTTEFWLTLGVNLLGALVTVGIVDPAGNSEWDRIAAIGLHLASTYGYQASRAKAKTLPPGVPGLALLALVLSAGACTAPGTVKAEAFSWTIEDVTARHDAYVLADPGLVGPDQVRVLAESARLRAAFQQAGEDLPVAAFEADFQAVATRFDRYVEMDLALDPWLRRDLLRSTALIRTAIERANPSSRASPGP